MNVSTPDLDALERAARAAICGDPMINARERAEGRIAFKESATPEAILALFSTIRALQERVEGAEKALRQFADEAAQWEGYSDTENLVEDWPTGPSSSVNVGHLRAARAYFAARTKAGDPARPQTWGEWERAQQEKEGGA